MKDIIAAIRIYFVLTLLTGVVYPLIMTGAGMSLFKEKTSGSLILQNGQCRGSALIGQDFQSNRYFQPRPSAIGYNPLPSGGSNLSPANLSLRDTVEMRRQLFAKANGMKPADVPSDILFTSGSGLDPHISPAATLAQIRRVCAARGLDSAGCKAVGRLVQRKIEGPQWGLFGDSRVNVLLLDRALDSLGVPKS